MDRGADPVNYKGSVDGNLLVIKYKIILNGKVPIFNEN
jgi:hypothetical protein